MRPDPSLPLSAASSIPVDPKHAARVEAIAARVRALAAEPGGGYVHVDKGGVHHVVPLPGDRRFTGRSVDVSALDHILHIDVERRLCVAEPGVSFDRLVEATLVHGLIPIIVPELKGITIGGAVAGCSVEAMSFKHGGFHDTCERYELVTGDGRVITCSRTESPELFEMVHGSYGTLAILTQLTFRLIPAKRYVRMEYRTLPNAKAFLDELRARIDAGDFDLIDGIVHSPTEHVLCLGRFVDEAPYVSDYTREHIYYKSTRTRSEDFLTTPDYCFRYDAECHWLTRTVPPLEWKPVRRLLGGVFLGSTNLIKWSKRLEKVLALKRRPEVVIDVFIPSRRYLEFFGWYAKAFDFYPLWIVPYRIDPPYPWISDAHWARGNDTLFIDCAIYGKRNDDAKIDLSVQLEEKVFALDGVKTLISRNHYTRERFWEIYSEPRYREAKAALDPKGLFKPMFEKLHRVG